MAWVARLAYASRISQILFAFIVTSLSIPLTEDIYSGSNPFFASTAACSSIVLLDGFIGFFAFKRPNDVHWHLTLSLDWLAFLMCLTLCGIFSLFANFADDQTSKYASLIISATTFSYALLLATLYLIVWTYWLKMKGRLPPPSTKRDYWYHLEDQVAASTQASEQ